MKQHHDFIDIAKGLGIIFVTLSHCVCTNWAIPVSNCYVPLFFVISGYTFTELSLKKKANRLLKPYIFCSVVFLLLNFILKTKPINIYNVLGIFYSRYTLYPANVQHNICFMDLGNAPLWFLTALFSSFVILKLLLLIPQKYTKVTVLLYLIVAIIFCNCHILLPWSIDSAFMAVFFMYAGQKIKEKNLLKYNSLILIAFIIYSIGQYFNGYANMSIREYGNNVLIFTTCGVTGSFCLIWFAQKLQKIKELSVLKLLGRNSLIIFCFQLPLIKASQTLATYLYDNLYFIALSQIIITLVLGYSLSIVLNKYLKIVLK